MITCVLFQHWSGSNSNILVKYEIRVAKENIHVTTSFNKEYWIQVLSMNCIFGEGLQTPDMYRHVAGVYGWLLRQVFQVSKFR